MSTTVAFLVAAVAYRHRLAFLSGAHMLSEDCTSTAPVHCLAQRISWVVVRAKHLCMSTEHVS